MASLQTLISTERISRKRPHSPDSSDDNLCSNYCENHINFVLESESPLPTDEDSESVHSIQLAGTASAKDTSDTSWTSDSVTMDVEIQEYDVATTQSDEKLLTNCDSSGCDDVLLTAAATASLLAARAGRSERSDCAPLASSVGVRRLSLGESSPWGADSSDASDDSSDSEVPRADYWECVRCKRKCTPLFRFCLKCFQLRKGYFCERPKRTHPRRRQRPGSGGPGSARCPSGSPSRLRTRSRTRSHSPPSSPASATTPGATPAIPRGDSGISLSAEDKEQPATGDEHKPAEESLGSASSQEVLGSTCTQDSAVGTSQEALTCEPSSDSSAMQCFMCLERPRDGGFCHRQNVHVLTCYRCALKVWNQTRRCPLCNKPPNNISRLIFG